MTDIETGTMVTMRHIGRGLVHATQRHLATDVTRDGTRCAVVLPAGPADRCPSRAELDALMGHLMSRARPSFKPDAEVGETELIAKALAGFLDRDPLAILAVAEAALTEANFHGTAEEVRGLREDIEQDEPPAIPGTFVRDDHPGDINDPERYPDD